MFKKRLSLKEANPTLAKEWHPTKNKPLTPKNVTRGSKKLVWWQCKEGHEWNEEIQRRVLWSKCPICNCLKTKYPALAKEWHPTKNKDLTPLDVTPGSNKKVWWKCMKGHEWDAVINSRSQGCGCPFCIGKRVTVKTSLLVVNPKLAKEWHPTKNGLKTPKDFLPQSSSRVWWKCVEGHEWEASIVQRRGGRRCPYCSGVRITKEKSIKTTHPGLLEEWNYLKNKNISPEDISFGSNRKVWWKCRNKHEWQAAVNNRSDGKECPYCSNRIANIDNCLATMVPNIAKQWHPSKNNFTAYDVTPGSKHKVWWVCEKGHEWFAHIYIRAEGHGCPICYRKNRKEYIYRRNIRFKHDVGIADKSKILGVAIDPAGNFHRGIIFDFLGKVIEKPFSIDTLKKGYDLLVNRINKSKKKIGATEVYIAIESAGTYSENLIRHLSKDFENVVTIAAINVAENRKQRFLDGIKSDDIDCGAVGDLLIRGEFNKVYPEPIIYYKLKNLVYWREKKLVLKRTLKNHITARFKRIYPGLNSDFEEDKKLYSEEYSSVLHLGVLKSGLICQEILEKSDLELARMFGYGGFQPGYKIITALKKRLNEMMFPDKEEAKAQLEILKRDIKLLDCLEQEILDVEKEIVNLGKKTPARFLMGQIKGLTDLFASMYIGVIGDIKKYHTAKQIYSFSGLSPKLRQSGEAPFQSMGIKKRGNAILRSILFKIASYVIISDPYYKEYHARLRKEKNRHWKSNRIAVSRRINNVLFALIRDKTAFIGKSLEVPQPQCRL